MNQLLRWLVVLFPLTAFSTETYLGVVSSSTVSPATFTASAGASLSLVCDGPVRYAAGSAASPPTADATSAPLVFGPDNLNVTQRILLPASQDRLSIIGAPTLVAAHRRSGPGVGFTCTVYTATPESPVISYTTADVQLYVDPTGNDSNDCTATGTSACLTIQGALNKSPKQLRHKLTVSIAAGNYAGFTVSGFTIDPSFQKTTGGILIDGALADTTVTTGSVTGTATSGSAGSGTTYGTLVHTGQTWTVSDLRGKYITITGGTGSGQVRVITANTADTVTIAGTWTAPNATSTYAIQSPSVVLTSSADAIVNALGTTIVAAAGVQVLNNAATGVSATTPAVVIRNIASNGAYPGFIVAGPVSLQLLQFRQFAGGVGSSIRGSGARVLLTAFSLVINATGLIAGSISDGVALDVASSYIQTGTGGNGIIATGPNILNVTSTQIIGTNTSGAGINVTRNGSLAATAVRCDCSSSATSACISVGAATLPTSPNQSATASILTGLDVTNCAYGVAAQVGNISFSQSATFSGNALTYSAVATNGGAIILPSAITITSGTADLAVDNGTATAAYGSLAAIYDCLPSTTGTMSRVCRL